MAKFIVSILESKKNGKRYIDMTDKSVSARLKEINKGESRDKWLDENKPFKVIYSEVYKKKEEAVERIEFMKTEERITIDFPKED